MTELEYGDKIYLHNQSTVYTLDGESIILVDTSVPRTVRLAQTPNIKRSLIIKDITGNASVNPILVSIAENTAGTVTLQGQTGREFQMFAPYGAVELTGYQNQWMITVPRSTCISNRGFRLPQNLNLALPPAVGAVRQSFPAMVFFPAIMQGVDIVPPNYNGLTISVAFEDQLSTADSTASLTSLFAQPNPPTTDPSSFSALTIIQDVTWNIPSDFPSLPVALQYLGDKNIIPGVTVTLAVTGDNITGLVNFDHPQASQIVIQGQTPIVFQPESTTVAQAIPGAVLVDITMTPSDILNAPVGSYILIDQVVGWPIGGTTPPGDLRRWTGIWPVVAHTVNIDGQNARIQISDWGSTFPTTPMVPKQARWRLLPTVLTVTGAGSLLFSSDGYTLNNLAIVGASNAVTGLTVGGLLNLNTVGITGFTGDGILGSYRAIIQAEDVFSCDNNIGMELERHATLAGDLSPSNTIICLNGNDDTGLLMGSSVEGSLSPLFACGNQNFGVHATNLSSVSLFNSYMLANGTGIKTETGSLAAGNSNTISKSNVADLTVVDGGQIRMSASSAFVLSTPNGQLNTDGSRIELST